MQNCVFCASEEIRQRTVAKNNLAFAFPTNIPITPGHMLICSLRHVATIGELRGDELLALFELRSRVAAALSRAFGAEGFNCAWNEGGVSGQAISHLHLHVVPRKAGDSGITEYEPRKFLYRPGSRETSSENELQAVVEHVKRCLT